LTPYERPISDHVVVQCPACGACESVEETSLATHADMVCPECGETWPAGGMSAAKPRRKEEALGPLITAERLPLVTYTAADDRAWKAKIEGDYWPEPPRPRRLPMIAAAVAAVFFLAAFFGAREAAVAALPDLAGLYASIGLPVNLDKLTIEDVSAERSHGFAGSQVSVRATIRNPTTQARHLPPLVAEIGDGTARLGPFSFDPPARTIAAGKSMTVLLDLSAVPENIEAVTLRFPRRGETLAAAGAARLAQE